MRVLRWGPMAVADFVAEFFETDLLRAAVAARGIFGAAMGPWSAGSTALLLLRAASDPYSGWQFRVPARRHGRPDQARWPPRRSTGRRGDSHGRGSGADSGEEWRRCGSRAARRRRNSGETRGLGRRSSADVSRLLDPVQLPPSFAAKMQHYRCKGIVAKLNLALDALPTFSALRIRADGNASLAGRIHIGPGIDYLERAFDDSKYGDFSRAPYLDISIPSILDSSLAPAGKHVMSIYMQFAPYHLKQGDWTQQRDALADTIVKTTGRVRARSAVQDCCAPDFDADGSRGYVRTHGRASVPWRAGARSAFHDAAAARLGALPHASEGTIPLRIGNPSRERNYRNFRRKCRPRNIQRSALIRSGELHDTAETTCCALFLVKRYTG